MNSRTSAALFGLAIIGFTVIITAAILSPDAPPQVVQIGDTKKVDSPTRYKAMFDSCLEKAPTDVDRCRWAASEADSVTLYWDGSSWKETP